MRVWAPDLLNVCWAVSLLLAWLGCGSSPVQPVGLGRRQRSKLCSNGYHGAEICSQRTLKGVLNGGNMYSWERKWHSFQLHLHSDPLTLHPPHQLSGEGCRSPALKYERRETQLLCSVPLSGCNGTSRSKADSRRWPQDSRASNAQRRPSQDKTERWLPDCSARPPLSLLP